MQRVQWLIFTGIIGFFIGVPALTGDVHAQETNSWSGVVPVRSFGYGSLTAVYWSPVNGQLAVASDSGLQFFNEALTLEGERRFQDSASAESFSPNIQYVALYEADGLIVRDTNTWEPKLALDVFVTPFWSPDSRFIAVWAGEGLQIWDVERGRMIREITELISQESIIQWSPDSQVIAVSGPGAIVMLRVDTGDIVRIHAVAMIANFAWSSDGLWLIIIGRKDPLPLDFDYEKQPVEYDLLRVDALTGEVVMQYDVRVESAGYESEFFSASGHVSVSPDGQYIAAELQRSFRYIENDVEYLEWRRVGMGIWDLESGEALHETTYEPFFDVYSVTWSRDGARFAASIDAALKVYAAATGEQNSLLTAYIAGYRPIVWTSEGLAAADGIWNVRGDYPAFEGAKDIDDPPEDFFQPAPEVECNNY